MNDVVVKAVLARGIGEVVVCGGARNAGLVAGFIAAAEATGDVRVWQHFEERSAAFFALGRTMSTGLPTAIVVTSGTAVAEVLPAMIEAHYQGRALLVISADRPAEYRGSGAPQAIEQVGIFGKVVDDCIDLDATDPAVVAGLAAQLKTWTGERSLHLNVCLDETIGLPDGAMWQSPAAFAKPQDPLRTGGLAQFLRGDIWKGLVVMLGGIEAEDREEVLHFCKCLAVPVLADASSGLREAMGRLSLLDGDTILKSRPPGKILRLGAVPVGRFWRDLENMPEIEVLSVSPAPFSGLSRESELVVGSVGRVLRSLGEITEIGDVLDHFPKNSGHAARVDELIETYPSSEAAMVRTLSVMCTTGDSVFLGNSLPVREWNIFAQRVAPYDDVRAMRGANGIDGQISCWLGAAADEEESWALLGDLTALYDVAGVAFAKQTGGKRVLAVMNNGGGQIFARLPRLRDMSAQQKKAVEQPQDVDFAGLAQLWKAGYLLIDDQEGFDALEGLGDGLTVVELVPDARETELYWQRLDALRQRLQ